MTTDEVLSEDHSQWLSDLNDQSQMEHSQKQGAKMAYDNAPKDDAVTIWMNEDKKSEKSPDFGGKGLIRGKETRVAGWRNITKDGRKTINLRFELTDGQAPEPNPVKKEEPGEDWF